MPRPADHHIAWARSQPARHGRSLAESGVDPPDLEAMGLPCRAGLTGAGEPLQAELERALASAWDAPGGRVRVTAGGSEANAVVFGALLEPGDEVLVESPGYQPHREAPGLFAVAVRRFRRPLEGDRPRLPEGVEAALGPATRMVVLTHLHNPTGTPLEEAEAAALHALAERRGLWILCDEIFRDALAGPRATGASVGPRWITTSSLTKVYGLAGLRIGWISASPEVLDRCAPVHHALSALPASPSVALALALVPHLDRLRDRSHRILEANRARWESLVRAGVPFASPARPRGTTAWALFPAAGQGDAFAAHASRHHDLAVVPGRFFGDSRGIRVGLGGEPERAGPAFDAFQEALATFETTASIPETP